MRGQFARAFAARRPAEAEDPYALSPVYSDADFSPDGEPTAEAQAREAARIAKLRAGCRS